jgi:hypothetical protein
MNRNLLKRFRANAFREQGGQCRYCNQPMWQDDCLTFAREHGLSLKHTRRRKCTAEHLVARNDGGVDLHSNIAAACLDCNLTRHRRKVVQRPERWRATRMRRACMLRANVPRTALHLVNQSSLAVFSALGASSIESNSTAPRGFGQSGCNRDAVS